MRVIQEFNQETAVPHRPDRRKRVRGAMGYNSESAINSSLKRAHGAAAGRSLPAFSSTHFIVKTHSNAAIPDNIIVIYITELSFR